MQNEAFTESIKHVKIPILVLDQKWHRLFALDGKPEEILTLEEELKEILAKQGGLNQENKELKRLKTNLMQGIVENMDDAESKTMGENKRLIDEINEKIAINEDLLLDIPREITEINDALMLATMDYCYHQLRVNYKEASRISEWIRKIRVELKKNIIRKQNREINNKEIYAYMHDIFGKDIINLFDVKNDDVDLVTGEDRATGDTSDSKKL